MKFQLITSKHPTALRELLETHPAVVSVQPNLVDDGSKGGKPTGIDGLRVTVDEDKLDAMQNAITSKEDEK